MQALNSRQLQYAILLSEVLNFSQVAEQVGITQPSLSKQILSLESELGIKLFDRNHTPLTITPAGEYFIGYAKELLYKEEQMYKAMDQFRSGENGRLVIGVSPFRSTYLMPDIVKKVKAKYPGVQVVLREENSTLLRKEAAEGKFDFAIVNLPVDDALMDIVPLEVDTLVLAVPNAMTDRVLPTMDGPHPAVEWADVEALPFVVVSPTQELRHLFDKMCAAADIRPNIAVEVMSISAAWAMAHAGVGAALLPLQFISSQHFDDNLTLYTIRSNEYSRQPVIITRRGQYESEPARYAKELLQNKSAEP